MRKEEYSLLSDFLYEAIYIPDGTAAPPKSVITCPELQVYIADFGNSKHDKALIVEVDGNIVGAIWARIMNDYGHIDENTPSLAMSVLKEDENILASLKCNLKSFIDFTIVDENGVLLVTDTRVLFCKYIGRNLSVVHNFDYKLITSFNLKEDDDKNKYIIFKYNGDRVKITNIQSGDILKVCEVISNKQRVL